MNWELDYINLVEQVITTGYFGNSRAGPAYALPGESLKIPLDKGFPMITTRKMYPAGVIGELAGFVRGAEDLATYEKYGCNYWGTMLRTGWLTRASPEPSGRLVSPTDHCGVTSGVLTS